MSAENVDIHAALVDGVAYAGRATPLGSAPVWQNISDFDDNPGFPNGGTAGLACGISIDVRGDNAWVKVLTTTGQVYQTHGDLGMATFVWDEAWFPRLPAPNPMVGIQNKGADWKN
ncbi:hypothetical protein ACODT3_18820 [Streptomyces sp. 4.24]|uniref:hypothetical protein n=1 Tax=Streptomyces tritrimontium TaxID=3406573 RepID=UPI003BB6D94E